jgi:hypothetical protein
VTLYIGPNKYMRDVRIPTDREGPDTLYKMKPLPTSLNRLVKEGGTLSNDAKPLEVAMNHSASIADCKKCDGKKTCSSLRIVNVSKC